MERVRVGKNLTDGAISRVFYLAFHSIAYDLVNPRLSEWASRSVRVKQSQCFRTSIFIPTVLFSLDRRRWKHMQNTKKMYGKHGLHVERYSKKFYTGRGSAEIQPLTLLYNIFDGKDTPFVYPLLTTGTPFTYLV